MRLNQTQKLFLVVAALLPAMANAQTKPATKPAPKPVAKPPAAAKTTLKPQPIHTGPPCTPGATRQGLWHMRAGFEFFDLDMTGDKAVARAGTVVHEVDSITYDPKTAKISFRRKGKDFTQWFGGCVARNIIHGRFSRHKGEAPKPTDDAAFGETFHGKRSWRQPVAAVAPTGGAAARPLVPAFAMPKSPCTPGTSRNSVWRVNANGSPLAFDLTAQSNIGAARTIGVNDKLDSITYDDKTAKIAFRRLGAGFTEWFDGCIVKNRIIGTFAHLASANAAKPTKASDYIYSFHGRRVTPGTARPRGRWSRDHRRAATTTTTTSPTPAPKGPRR